MKPMATHSRRRVWCLALLAITLGAAEPIEKSDAVRFAYVDVFLDSGKRPLAAYQFELRATSGDVAVVGIENGDAKGFTNPPYYDPAALSGGRVIIAAFNTGADLPIGKTRVARVHVRTGGDKNVNYIVKMMAAGSTDGTVIPVSTSIAEGEAR